MRQSVSSSGLVSATLLLLSHTSLITASPYPRDDIHDALGAGFLMPRACDSYCGYDNQYCCSAGETCYTSAGIAGCAGSGAGGAYDFYTTTWTETRTYTSTYSSYFPAATTPASSGDGADCVPTAGSGEVACGAICCASWQYCAYDGQCMPNAGATGAATSYTVVTSVGVVTTQFSAPYRVTSGTTITSTATLATPASATTTSSSTGTPAAVTTTSGNQLSGGAIAGIVIGVIAGVILLLLLCACCLVRGAWHGILAIFGLGGKRKDKERVEVVEERYSRHGSAHGGRPAHRTWFGGRPATVTSSRRNEKKSGSGAGWIAASAGAVMLLLGLRRDHKRKEAQSHKSRSDWGSSYYTDSYTASSPSSASSDRRTRDTRRSRTSRGTRASRR